MKGEAVRPVGECERFFVGLVSQHQDGLFSGLHRLTGSRTQAQDLTQDVFLAAWKSLIAMPREKRDGLAARPWLWKIAVNLLRNDFRNRKRRPQPAAMDYSIADLREGPEYQVLAREVRDEVAALLADTPDDIRLTLVMHYLGDMTFAEIAAITGAAEGTVRSRASRGLQLLKRRSKGEVA
jgi:RNA polymerase sigma-70 factor (ECF subfamily)